MAWNVVIAGGGFGGATCARELEKLLPTQSARMTLVNDVNFVLYTPFLPEAAAGTLEPRHVVTPLREVLDRTTCDSAPSPARPRCPDRRAADPRGRERGAPLRPARDLGRLGLADAAGSGSGPARDRVQEPRRRDLAAQPRDRVPRAGQLDRGPAAAGGAAHLRLRRRRLRRSRGAGRAAGLRRRARWAPTRSARLHGMRWILVEAKDRVLPEIDQALADYAVRRAARTRDRGAARDHDRRGDRRQRAAVDRGDGADPDRGLDRRRRAASEPAQPLAAARREGARDRR